MELVLLWLLHQILLTSVSVSTPKGVELDGREGARGENDGALYLDSSTRGIAGGKSFWLSMEEATKLSTSPVVSSKDNTELEGGELNLVKGPWLTKNRPLTSRSGLLANIFFMAIWEQGGASPLGTRRRMVDLVSEQR